MVEILFFQSFQVELWQFLLETSFADSVFCLSQPSTERCFELLLHALLLFQGEDLKLIPPNFPELCQAQPLLHHILLHKVSSECSRLFKLHSHQGRFPESQVLSLPNAPYRLLKFEVILPDPKAAVEAEFILLVLEALRLPRVEPRHLPPLPEGRLHQLEGKNLCELTSSLAQPDWVLPLKETFGQEFWV